jgi:signal transduction histidine kinase
MSVRLFRHFSLLSAGVWVGLALVLGTGVTYLVERKMLERTTLASLDYFKNLARFIITKEDFVRPRSGAEYEAFDRLIREEFFTGHVVTIKIYDRSGTTIYHSRAPELVGRAFPDNAALRQALRGETVVGLSDLQGAEHLGERRDGYSQLFEVYIPIFLEGTGTVIGAYEIYSPIDPFYRKVWDLRLSVWGAVLAGLGVLYTALALTFRRASRTIVEQNVALERTAGDLRNAYEQLRQAQSQLVQSEKLASTGRLAAGIVHEIGNPLGSILGLLDLQLLCRGRPDERAECRDRSERMAGEIVRLKRILQGLLDYAHPSPPQLAPLDVNAVVERALGLVAAQKGFERIAWTRSLAGSLPPARADAHPLEQVLLNLLLNAAYAAADGGAVRVETGVSRGGRWGDGDARVGRAFASEEEAVAIAITDGGSGIPLEHLGRIFEPFFSTRRRGEGSGLGLAICHSLIDALEGALIVESRGGVGTTVRVLLPASASDAAETTSRVGQARG